MAWVRLDDGFPQHPKVAEAGPLGLAMHVAAICYCNRYLTDGYVPKAVAATLVDLSGLSVRVWEGQLIAADKEASWELVVEGLEQTGLWEREKGGWRVHDYHDYQPSRAEILAERQAAKERMAKARSVRGKPPEGSGDVQANNPRTSRNPTPTPKVLSEPLGRSRKRPVENQAVRSVSPRPTCPHCNAYLSPAHTPENCHLRPKETA